MDDHWRVIAEVKQLTGELGCDVVIEAVGQALGNLTQRSDVVTLQVAADALAIDAQARREVVAGKEQREHRAGSQLGGIAGPDKSRQLAALRLMHKRGARRVQSADVEADALQRPAGGAIATGEAAPDILVRIDVDR